MKDFIHIIITRFNVPTKTWDITREGRKPLSEEWLSDRFQIFQKYCLPSFKNQKNQNFVWLVFFDINTSEQYKEIILSIQKDYPLFTPVYINEFAEMLPKLEEIIPQYFNLNTNFIITSDIDNDDMLHEEFVSTVQQKYQPLHNLVIDIRTGIQLTKTGGKNAFANVCNFPSGPFVSLIEDKNIFKTVINEQHTKYRQYKNYLYFDKKPLFIQLIHENNLVNDTLMENKRLHNIHFQNFGIIQENEFTISMLGALKHNMSRIKNKIIKKIFK